MKSQKNIPHNQILFPEPFKSYLQKRKIEYGKTSFNTSKRALWYFSKWLELEKLNLSKINYEDLQCFSKYLKVNIENVMLRLDLRKSVQACVISFCKNGVIKTDHNKLYPGFKYYPHLKPSFPICAKQYLELLKSTLAPSSVRSHKSDVGRLHIFIKKEKITLKNLRRKHLENLLKDMKNYGLKPNSRVCTIINIRRYLYWLKEHNLILAMPESLLFKKDFPPIPKGLPRPFSTEVDEQIKNKFLEGSDIFYDGLLLMRMTGIRVGELILLEFNCIKNDFKQNYYLKVPLGKLKTERMVPLCKVGIDLIKKIQNQTKQHANENNIKLLDRLILSPKGYNATFEDIRARMDEIQLDLPLNQSAKSHQLRHTCATELLNSGMNLVALKEFLGHRDIKMTLRYAAVAPETVRTQFNQATEQIQKKYSERQVDIGNSISSSYEQNSLSDLIADLKKRPISNAKSKALIRRIQRLQKDISSFKN